MNTFNQVQRFDYGQITSVERTPQGFLKLPGFATRIGVFPYKDANGQVRRELRHPDDVFDPESLATLRFAPVTLEHPPVMLTPENVNEYRVGTVTDRVEVNRDLVDVDLIVQDAAAIDAVENKGVRELSSGYLADLIPEQGIYNGAEYDYRQKNIKHNHLAIVKRGRGGPEVRLRLDSADAVIQDEEVETPASKSGSQGDQGVEGSEGNGTKEVVIIGQKVSMPSDVADVVQDMLDKYDEMRGQVLKQTEEESMKDDKKDVDISQKGISPSVDVQQMAPDGRASAGKTGAGDKSGPSKAKGDEDVHGIVGGVKAGGAAGGKALNDDDEDEKKEEKKDEFPLKEKKDYDAPGGAGAARSPVDQLKADMEGMKQAHSAQMDAMQAKLDEYASASMGQGEHKMDSADVQSQVRTRVKLERLAEKVLPRETVAKFDSMSDDEIRGEVIKHSRPGFDPKGKSTVYLQARFDSITEDLAVGESVRKEMGAHLLVNRMDSEESDPMSKRRQMIETSREMWKQPLRASKKN